MARDGFDTEVVPYTKSNPPDISKLKAKNGLDNGVHFTAMVVVSPVSAWKRKTRLC